MTAELSETDWDKLFDLLVRTKRDAIERVDAKTLDLSYPFELEIGDNGLVPFADVFPYGDMGPVDSGHGNWIVEDLYCVVPGCQCHEVLLVFIPEYDAHPKNKRFPTFFYDYRARKIGKIIHGMPAGFGTLEELVAKLRDLRPAFELKIENRHLSLRVLYMRRLMELPQRDDQDVEIAQKVGRNDPCPCGSGKKYKRCCGAPGVIMPGDN